MLLMLTFPVIITTKLNITNIHSFLFKTEDVGQVWEALYWPYSIFPLSPHKVHEVYFFVVDASYFDSVSIFKCPSSQITETQK